MQTATAAPRSSEAEPAVTLRPVQLPPIGAVWPGEGGIFAGILRGNAGDYAVIVPADPASDIDDAPWKEAIERANQFRTDLHGDFSAATRAELALCFHNVPKLFKRDLYWSATPVAGDESYAWYQDLCNGYQDGDHKGYELRARAVRRLPI
jgi:hypothetical protein